MLFVCPLGECCSDHGLRYVFNYVAPDDASLSMFGETCFPTFCAFCELWLPAISLSLSLC